MIPLLASRASVVPSVMLVALSTDVLLPAHSLPYECLVCD
jgi:hypothetical protein